MTQTCCTNCRIRFTPAAAAHLTTCPECHEPLQPAAELAGVMGYQLFRLEDAPHALPEAMEVSMPIPDSELERS